MSEPAKTPDDVRRALREHGATVIDDATDPVIIFDQSERIVDVNDAAVATFGYERDELLGHTMAKLAPPGATEAVENGAFRSSREGLAVADVLRRKDGVCFPAVCSTRLFRVGGSDYAEVIVRDLAGHEDPTLRDLPWQMAREWSLFQHMPSGYALCRRVVDESGDVDFVFVDVNPAFAKITRERDVVGRPVSEAMPALWEVAPELRQLVDRVIGGGEPGMIELFVPPYDMWISATVHSPAPEHVAVVFDDVTSRRQAEEDRRATAELLRGIFEHSGASIGLWSLDGYMIMCNRLGAGDLGGEPSDYVGRSMIDIFGEEQGALYLERLKRAAETGEVGVYEERAHTDANGVTHWERGIYAPLLDGEGRATAVEALGVDITERKAIEDELQRLNVDLERRVEERTEELRASNADLEAFSYSVSHDLRAPLRHASGFARLLVDDFGDDMPERASKHLGKVVDSVKQMGELIDELLQFSRAGRARLSFRWVDMNKLVSEARDMLEDDCRGRRISWSVGALPQVWGDGSMLCQAWVNLLGNAVKYTRPREEARIAVDAHETPDEYEFVIRDNGVGFEMQHVDKLFGVFQRLSADPQFEGVGIGLANVRRIITRHGGRTWGRGEPDVGAEFGFSLPKRQETQASL